MSETLQLVRDLVAIPSINPMGRSLTGPEYLEGRVSDYLEKFFQGLGVEYERVEVAPGRANVIARFDVPGAQRTLLLDAHQDTVPVEGMTIPPFDPQVRDGRVYGRGSCDIKGGMAAMLSAFKHAFTTKSAGSNLVMSCTCDEEATMLGVTALARSWRSPGAPGTSRLLAIKPDLAIVAEPTNLDVVVAHRGATRWRIVTHGVACHSSEPRNGVNAIYRMAQVVRALEEYADWLPGSREAHSLCGASTLSVGRIDGGQSVNVVPDRCSIEIDRRVIPGEDPAIVIDEVTNFVRKHIDFEIEVQPPWIEALPLSDDDNGPLCDELLGHVAAVVKPRCKIGVPYGTNASRIAAAGVPAVVFGPGSILQAHTKDEWLPLDELEQATEILKRICAASS